MRAWTAFQGILANDVRTYYLKPPNVSWGLIFPFAWAGMFFVRSGSGFDSALALLLAPISLEMLMLAKTGGAILFGVANDFVPVVMAAFLVALSGVDWGILIPAVVLIAVSSAFLGLFIAVSVNEVFEAQRPSRTSSASLCCSCVDCSSPSSSYLSGCGRYPMPCR